MRRNSLSNFRPFAAALFIATALAANGCGPSPSPQGTVVQVTEQQSSEQVVPPQPLQETRPVLLHRVTIVAAEWAPGGGLIASALAEALARRGVQIVDGSPRARSHLVVAAYGATRSGGTWGGIPRQQVMLRYTLLDTRTRQRLGQGVDAASFADPTVAAAQEGALRRAADNLAGRIVTTMARLPVPAEIPEPAVAEPAAPMSIAPLPFHNATGRPELTGWCETLTAVAVRELIAAGRYRVLERTRFAEVVKEDDIAGVFGAPPARMSELGRQLGADLLLVGEVSVRPDGQLALTARFVRDGEVCQVILAAAPPERSNDLEREFRRQLPQPVEDWIAREIDLLRQMPVVWPEGN